MQSTILEHWHYQADISSASLVLPDGCQDLILHCPVDSKPHWFVSELYDQAKMSFSSAGSTMYGWRLQPGVRIHTKKLLASVNENLSLDTIEDCINDNVTMQSSVKEAIECIRDEDNALPVVAKQLGVSVRTLQRLLLKETGKTCLLYTSDAADD